MVDSFRKYSDLDIARSVIVSATYSGIGTPNKIHVLKLDYLANFFGIQCPIKDALNVLEGLREVQHLGNGFWVPAPTRAIMLDNEWMICSPLPTPQLSSGLRLLEHSGFARLSKKTLPNILTQRIEDWMGGRMNYLSEWICKLTSIAKDKLQSTTLDEKNLEFYVPWNQKKNKNSDFKNWVLVSDLDRLHKNEVFLTRALGAHISKYYWCSFVNGILMESLIPGPIDTNDIIKTQFALEMLFNADWRKIKVISNKSDASFICKYPLPIEMDRFLTAIGKKSEEANTKIYVVSHRHVDFVKEQLSSLHIKIG